MAKTEITMRCGHKMTVTLPDNKVALARIMANYKQQDCLICRRKKEQLLREEKEERMRQIMLLCKPFKTEDEKLESKAEKIRLHKLSMLDDMFEKLVNKHGFASSEESITFDHYRQRTVQRFCEKDSVIWWLNRENAAVEDIIEDLKEKTFVVDGKIYHPADETAK